MGISQKAYFGSSKVKIRLDILNKISTILSIKPSDICKVTTKCGGEIYETKYNQWLDFIKKIQYYNSPRSLIELLLITR